MASPAPPPPAPYGADITHVIDCIYLGSAPPQRLSVEPGASIATHLLEALRVAYVINVAAKTEPCVLPRVTYYADFRVDDQNTDITARNLLRHLPQCAAIVDSAKRDNKAVYIHCTAGLSRSPAIVLGLLIVSFGMTLREAWTYLRARRPVYPQPCYFRQLQVIEVRRAFSLSSPCFGVCARLPTCVTEAPFLAQYAARPDGAHHERDRVRPVLRGDHLCDISAVRWPHSPGEVSLVIDATVENSR